MEENEKDAAGAQAPQPPKDQNEQAPKSPPPPSPARGERPAPARTAPPEAPQQPPAPQPAEGDFDEGEDEDEGEGEGEPEGDELTMAEALARHEGGASPGGGAPGAPGTPGAPGAPGESRGQRPGDRGGQYRGRGGRRRRGRDRGRQEGGRQEAGRREERRQGVDRRQDDSPYEGVERREAERRGERPAAQPPRRPSQGLRREILANTSFEETRLAIIENGRLVELLWERRDSKSIVGNIYKGKVENVLPGISSAFINIGFEKNAYLYISDALGDGRKTIDQILKKGQEVMIQVAKEAIGTKGMKVTMEVTLPGRYLVLSPLTQSVGISKHIEDPVERRRISEILDRLSREVFKGLGVVVRTEAEGAGEEELRREAQYLMRAWEAVDRKFSGGPAPALLHEDLDLPMQVARDLMTEGVYVYLIDNKETYAQASEFIGKLSPELAERVRLYDGKTPIFTAFNIEPEIEKLRQTKVALPSGGTIVIQEAESLCAIDVNTGRFTGSRSQEETVTMNNIEAAVEVAHQLRLRNIGGIIVVDFIDMKRPSNRQKVMEAFSDAVRHDRAKIRILPITRLGLIELTRERRRESTISLMTDECPECMGSGRVLSAESMRIRVQREIHELTQGRPGGNIRIVLQPQLADAFREKQKLIEQNVHRSIKIVADANLQWEDYRIILE